MASRKSQPVDQVKASPTKRFFVEMLTRDIDLEDAILDLLDNCIDGLLRLTHKAGDKEPKYRKHWANITLSPEKFAIEDNCGGIDLSIAVNYAFMMGRPADDLRDTDIPTVGMYGIGMKRAIFKMGRTAVVRTNTGVDSYEVTIPPKWFGDELNWNLPLQMVLGDGTSGTLVEVRNLVDDVKRQFSPHQDFIAMLRDKIATHYSFILSRGFTVKVNGKAIEPKHLGLLMSPPIPGAPSKRKGRQAEEESWIAPYMYSGDINGVHVQLYVGLYRRLPSQDDEDREQHEKLSRDTAGWTIICNDRIVLYCDKSRLTGWGEANVPSFHPQFNAITGTVIFRSNDAFKLPVNTTKRGINANSELYLYVKDYMREGLRQFTQYTNRWKAHLQEEKKKSSAADLVPLHELDKKVPEEKWSSVRPKPGIEAKNERKFTPSLPEPAKKNAEERFIRFARPLAEIQRVSKYLFDELDHEPSEVGEKCFERTLTESMKKR